MALIICDLKKGGESKQQHRTTGVDPVCRDRNISILTDVCVRVRVRLGPNPNQNDSGKSRSADSISLRK